MGRFYELKVIIVNCRGSLDRSESGRATADEWDTVLSMPAGWELPSLPTEIQYVGLLFVLFVVPRILQRYGVPSAVTAIAFGMSAGIGFDLFFEYVVTADPLRESLRGDPTVSLLSTLGIVSLFLFAGLDVQVSELRREMRVLIEHLVIGAAGLAIVTFVVLQLMFDDARPALLVALALVTPSTGFILDSLGAWGLSESERFWIRSKAVATELVALAVLFFVLQSESWDKFAISAFTLIAMIAVLPAVFRWFASAVIPHAPNSEFGFLMMVGAACAVVTRSLGVYYLVGAFAVGMAAQQFRRQLPALASLRMLGAVESFASLFVPFYFFHAGLELQREDMSLAALGLGIVLILVTIPFRLAQVMLHRAVRLSEGASVSLRVGVPMLPTTVFTLVIAEILRDQFQVSPVIFGGLVIYTLINTLIPGLFMRSPTYDFEDELVMSRPVFEMPEVGDGDSAGMPTRTGLRKPHS
jgi:Kef-type K+ transport system membrane component KefB